MLVDTAGLVQHPKRRLEAVHDVAALRVVSRFQSRQPSNPIGLGKLRRIVPKRYSTSTLWEAATSAFSLERWVAEKKFGPHLVVAKTPIANIRLTTFFAGESEVRLVDPWRIRFVESVGCTVAT